jgi:ActR/RegA family two-component response regulator
MLVAPICRILHLGGVTSAVLGGLYAAEVPNTVTGQAGLAAAVSGCVIALASAAFGYLNDQGKRAAERDRLILEDRKQARAEKDLKGQLATAQRDRDELAARLKRLEAVSSDVPANAGRLDASLNLLAERGWIERPSSANAPPSTAWPTVLVVEDDPSTMRAWTSILTRKGFDVMAAGTVEVAVAKLEARPSFALLDLTLPDGNGEAVLEAIHALGLPTRVIVVSGSADRERRAKIEANYHPAAILPKPANLLEILAILQPNRGGDNLPVDRPPVLPSPPKGG